VVDAWFYQLEKRYILTKDKKNAKICIDRKEKATIDLLFFSRYFSVPISPLLCKIWRTYVELTTCKVFRITIFFGRQILLELFIAVAVHLFVLEASTPCKKASKSSPATIANQLFAILSGSKHLRHVQLVHIFLVIPSLSTKIMCFKSISLFTGCHVT